MYLEVQLQCSWSKNPPGDRHLAALTVKVFDPQGADPALNAAPPRRDLIDLLVGHQIIKQMPFAFAPKHRWHSEDGLFLKAGNPLWRSSRVKSRGTLFRSFSKLDIPHPLPSSDSRLIRESIAYSLARGRTPGNGGEFTLPQNQISFRIPLSQNPSDAFHLVSPFVRICKLTIAQKSRTREYSDEQTKGKTRNTLARLSVDDGR
jgi:hypothetical protein